MSVAYCSDKCMAADANRHKAECMAVTSDKALATLVRRFSQEGASDTAKLYRVGGSAAHRITVRRTIPSRSTAGGGGGGGVGGGGGGGGGAKSVKRRDMRDGAETNPLDGYRKRFAPDVNVACRPVRKSPLATKNLLEDTDGCGSPLLLLTYALLMTSSHS